MSNVEEKTVLLVTKECGPYLPYMFSKTYLEDKRWVGAKALDIEILAFGPIHPFYHDAWERVSDAAKRVDEDGAEWRVWEEGDLFIYTGDGEQWT